MHNTEIKYEGGLEQLATDLGNLRYDILEKFLGKLAHKLYIDALADHRRNRLQLSSALNSAHYFLSFAKNEINQAWKISKPYME